MVVRVVFQPPGNLRVEHAAPTRELVGLKMRQIKRRMRRCNLQLKDPVRGIDFGQDARRERKNFEIQFEIPDDDPLGFQHQHKSHRRVHDPHLCPVALQNKIPRLFDKQRVMSVRPPQFRLRRRFQPVNTRLEDDTRRTAGLYRCLDGQPDGRRIGLRVIGNGPKVADQEIKFCRDLSKRLGAGGAFRRPHGRHVPDESRQAKKHRHNPPQTSRGRGPNFVTNRKHK